AIRGARTPRLSRLGDRDPRRDDLGGGESVEGIHLQRGRSRQTEGREESGRLGRRDCRGRLELQDLRDRPAGAGPREYGGAAAGGLGALVIYAYIQKKDWKNDASVQAAMKWMTEKFEIDASNAYYMYALERAGILYGTETFGSRLWYREGANAILRAQKSDGS